MLVNQVNHVTLAAIQTLSVQKYLFQIKNDHGFKNRMDRKTAPAGY
jgi:hypothetical protein